MLYSIFKKQADGTVKLEGVATSQTQAEALPVDGTYIIVPITENTRYDEIGEGTAGAVIVKPVATDRAERLSAEVETLKAQMADLQSEVAAVKDTQTKEAVKS